MLNTILPYYQQVVSLPNEVGGTTLLFHPSCVVFNSSTLELGWTTWAQLEIGNNLVSIAVIYASSASPRERNFLWHKLKALLLDGQWIFMGDFSMIEHPLDSYGPSPLIYGSQLETWCMLKTRFDLVDALSIARTFRGTQFTRRSSHGEIIDQSRLDRFYLSDCGFWTHAIHRLEHIQDQTLSDHDPIILTNQTAPQTTTSSLKKTSYFKDNPSILKREGTMEALQAAWTAHPIGISDPTLKFSLA